MSGATRVLAAAAVAASVTALAGCMPLIRQSPMGSDERTVGEVSTVVLGTSGELTITEGEPELLVHASEDALPRLTSEVNDGVLVLGATPGSAVGLTEIRYELTVPALEAIEVDGSGDVEIRVPGEGSVRVDIRGSGDVSWDALDGDDVKVRVAGSGDVRLGGSTVELAVEVDGSGDVDAGELASRRATVVVRGSGDVAVSAEEHLAVQIAGSGRVTYAGDPELDTDIWGSGEVVRG